MKGCPIAKVLTFWIPLKIEKRDYPDSFQVAQMVKCLPAMRRPEFNPWVRKILWRREWQTTPVFLPGGIPWTKETGGLQSVGSQKVGHN